MSKIKAMIAICAVISISVFLSCEKETDNQNEVTLKVSDFKEAGEIHNAFLTNFKENFIAVEGIEDLDERIEVINNFNKKFVSSLDLSTKEKQMIIQGLDGHKDLVVTKNLVGKAFRDDNLKSTNTEDANIFDLIEKLKTSNQINENTHSILSRLSTDLKSNYEHSLSDAQQVVW